MVDKNHSKSFEDFDKIRVLILKAPSDECEKVDPYVQTLTSYGINTIMIPNLEFRFKNLIILADYLKHPLEYSGLIINSPRCANALIQSFKLISNDELLAKWKKLKCFVVGDATARLINDNLGFSCEGNSCGSLSHLLSFISQDLYVKPFLLPVGNLHKNQEGSIKTKKVEVYETVEHCCFKENLCKFLSNNNQPLFISFFSPSGVKSAAPYIKQYPVKQIKFIAIGPTTAREIESCLLEVNGVCAKPTPEHLLDTIREMIKL